MTIPFKARSSEDSPKTITYTPWTKAELHAKDFPMLKRVPLSLPDNLASSLKHISLAIQIYIIRQNLTHKQIY